MVNEYQVKIVIEKVNLDSQDLDEIIEKAIKDHLNDAPVKIRAYTHKTF